MVRHRFFGKSLIKTFQNSLKNDGFEHFKTAQNDNEKVSVFSL